MGNLPLVAVSAPTTRCVIIPLDSPAHWRRYLGGMSRSASPLSKDPSNLRARRRARVTAGVKVLSSTVFAVLALLSIGAPSAQGVASIEEGTRPGDRAPGFALQRLNGDGTVRLEEFRGDVVVINFFAASCPSCLEELPVFQKLYEELRDRGVTVIGVGILDDYRTLSAVVEDLGLTYPSGYDSNNELVRAYRLRRMPTTVFLDGSGIIREVRAGALDEEQLRAIVEPLL